MKSTGPVILLAVLMWLFTLPPACSLGMNGAIFLAQVAPGEHVKHEMSVSISKNESPMNISVDILDMQQGLHGETLAENASLGNPYSAKSFLNVSPAFFHIDSGSTQAIQLEGDIPSQASPGGRYALINVKGLIIQPNASKNKSGITFGMAINGIVELTVSGNKTTKSGEIKELRAQEPASGKQQNISVIFRNTGNIHYKVKILGALVDQSDKVLANATATSSIPIMPGALRMFNFSVLPNKELVAGTYDINATVRLEDGTVMASNETRFEVKT